MPQKLRLVHQMDETIRELAIRLLCRNYQLDYRFRPYAAYKEQTADEEHPPLDYRGQPRLTPRRVLAEIEAARQADLTAPQRAILPACNRQLETT